MYRKLILGFEKEERHFKYYPLIVVPKLKVQKDQGTINK